MCLCVCMSICVHVGGGGIRCVYVRCAWVHRDTYVHISAYGVCVYKSKETLQESVLDFCIIGVWSLLFLPWSAQGIFLVSTFHPSLHKSVGITHFTIGVLGLSCTLLCPVLFCFAFLNLCFRDRTQAYAASSFTG